MSSVKDTLVKAAVKIPLSVLWNFSSTRVLIPFYHLVSDQMVHHVRNLQPYKNVTQFREDIRFLSENFSIIDLGVLLDHWAHGHPLPRRALLLTFDDGLREQYETIAPILKHANLPATFFLTSSFLDNKELGFRHKTSILIHEFGKSSEHVANEEVRNVFCDHELKYDNFRDGILSLSYEHGNIIDDLAAILSVDYAEYLATNRPYMTSAQVQSLIDDGFTIGAHSIDHPYYPTLSVDHQLYQTRESMNYIQGRFALSYRAFAFPFNERGISRDYYEMISGDELVHLSVGHVVPMDKRRGSKTERIWLEDPALSTERVIKTRLIKGIYARLRGTGKNEAAELK